MDDTRQAFRTSSSKVISIPTRHDPKTGQRVVRWKDIQQYFENARGILKGEDAVLFLTNDDLEDLIPLRIAHHPGVILEVFEDNHQSSTNATKTLDSTSSSDGSSKDMALVARNVVSSEITEVDDDNQTVVGHLQGHPSEKQIPSPRASSPLHNTYSNESVPTPQESSVSNTNLFAHDFSPTQQLEVDSTKEDELTRLNQQIQQLEDILHQVQSSVGQTHQSTQYPEQQVQQAINEQTIQQLQKSVHETTDRDCCLSLDKIREEISRKLQQVLSRHILIQYRVQALFSIPLEDLPIPRFFIILPKDVGVKDDEPQRQSSLQFRLHFLCELGSDSEVKDTKRMHEVHMTNHAGYDLERPKEFFDKYASYVLTMMYMVKYGVMIPGFIVPPLGQSKFVARIKENQEHLGSIKKNISQLVNDTINYLEDMAHTIDSDMDVISQWSSGAAGLEELKSYLSVNEGDRFPGDMYQSIAEDGHCSWICSEHQDEWHEWTIQRLKDAVSAVDGTYTEDEDKDIDIKIASEKVGKQLYDAIAGICKICISRYLSLNMECERLSLMVDTYEDVKDVIMTVKRLSDLTVDELEFIQQGILTELEIKFTPQQAEEDRLAKIIQQSPKLEELRIGCLCEHFLAVIKLVISTRENILRSGRQSELTFLEVTDERSGPFNLFRPSDEFDHIEATVTFRDGESDTFDMNTRINLQNEKMVTEESQMSNVFRQYGWSIDSLDTSETFNDHLATLLDDATKIKGSQLRRLILSPSSLTNIGMDAMDRVIKRSQELVLLWLYILDMEKRSQQEKAILLLDRCREKLSRMTLHGDSIAQWLPRLARTFPTRSSFPKLERLHFGDSSFDEIPHKCIQWLVAMVSDPPQPPETAQQEEKPSVRMTRLMALELTKVTLRPQDWETMIKALDFSSLEKLKVSRTNFSLEQLDLLIECIAGIDPPSVPLRFLDFTKTSLFSNADKNALRARIQKVAPKASVKGCNKLVAPQETMNETQRQAFRTSSSSKVIDIPTRHDPKTGQRVVRWKDIQQYFKNAQGILSSEGAILFLTDDNLEDLIPLRIAHHPGEVLEVLVEDIGQNNMNTTRTLGSMQVAVPAGISSSDYALVNHTYSHQSHQFIGDQPQRPRLEMNSSMNQQEELQQLKQQIEELLRQSEQQIQQKIQHSEQQTRRQIEEILEKMQQLQGCVNELVQVNNLPLDKMREILQGREETLRRQSVIQYRIQALLITTIPFFPIPRFFIILPSDNDLDHRQERRFRLYFLCECNCHTQAEDNTPEIHMTEHAGYDLKRPKEFLAKYGSYVLTVMYMFKYGAAIFCILLPPLARSKLMVGIENIDQLVDDTIAYLEEMTRAMGDNNINPSSQWKLKHTDLDELKSYFVVNEGEHFPGNLYQRDNSTWLCGEHLRELVMERLKSRIDDYGGTYTNDQGKIDVKITSKKVDSRLYDSIVDVCGIQSVDHKPHLTVDCGRLLLTVGAPPEVQDVAMTIKQLSDLTEDDLEFIQQCNLTQLAIKFTPREEDEDRLTNIMEQSPKLRELRIGCRCERSLAIIKLVISSREKALQNGGQSALHVLEVTGEEFEPFGLYKNYQGRGHVTSKLTFSKESSTPDMDTCINMPNEQLAAEGDWMCNFFRQYGWSISSLLSNRTFTNRIATLWDDATQILGSRLKQLDLSPHSLENVGLDALDRIIRRSQRLVTFNLRLDLGLEGQHEKSRLLFGRYGRRLDKLMLFGDSIQQWLPSVQAITSRTSFPVLSGFFVYSWSGEREVPHKCAQWLATMVSTPLQLPGITQETMKSSATLTRLKAFELAGVTLHPQDWETVINAIDFSELEMLNLHGTNISQEQLDLLIERIAGIEPTSVPLKDLNLKQTDSLADTDKDILQERFRKVAPRVSIWSL